MQKHTFVKISSVNRLKVGVSPTLLRLLSDSKSFCTFADVKQYPNGRGKAAT